MKAERRHELQHNPTADWLAAVIERVKPYSRAIVGVAVAAAVLLITYVVLSGRAEKKQSAAWTDYYQAIQSQSTDDIATDLETVAREHSGVPAGLWAEVALADLKLGEGIDSLFRDKQAAQTKLTSAVQHYETVLADADDPLLAARARFGLGRALESLGKLKEAREVYQALIEGSGSNAYVPLADARLKDLKRSSTQDFYAWFAKQEPAALPAFNSLPGTPGEKLPFDPSGFGPPGGLNLSGKSILDIPTIDKQTTGPLLTPEAKTSETEKKDGNAKETNESAKSDISGDGKSDETKQDTPDAKQESKDDEKQADSAGKDAKGDAGSATKSNDGANADESSDGKPAPKDGL